MLLSVTLLQRYYQGQTNALHKDSPAIHHDLINFVGPHLRLPTLLYQAAAEAGRHHVVESELGANKEGIVLDFMVKGTPAGGGSKSDQNSELTV